MKLNDPQTMHIFSLFVYGFFTSYGFENPLYLTCLSDKNHRRKRHGKSRMDFALTSRASGNTQTAKSTAAAIGGITDAEKNDYNEAQMLRNTQLDGMPKASSQSSRTEKVALTYNECLQTERSSEAQDLMSKMQAIRFYLQVYDAMMASLTPDEAWLARERYVNEKSLGRMLLEMPDSLSIRSKTTLSKRCADVIDQLERFLAHFDANSR